jgi:imidazolonepropionase-like amidohydrolase
MTLAAPLLAAAIAGGLVAPRADDPSQHSAAVLAQRLRTEAVVLQAAEVHTGDGNVFKPGVVVLLDGKVVAAGQAPPLPAGSRVVDCGKATITPGLVDAACQLGVDDVQGYAEESSEVIPQLDAAESVDYFSRDFERLADEGVTTVYVTGSAASVISCKGAAVKTGGPIAARKLAAKACVKGTIGPEASYRGGGNGPPNRFNPPSFHNRRPTTRMGAAWVFRTAFFDARAFQEKGATSEDPAAMKALLDVLDGKVALRMQARESLDFRSAARLCDEVGVKNFTIEYGIEAAKNLDLLESRKIPVIFGPVRPTDSRVAMQTFEDATPALTTPKLLAEHGVLFCLTASDGIGEGGLARQAGLAIRYGLDREKALKAVSGDAAAMLGLESRVGRLAEGLDADLVVWNGAPFDDASKPILVLIDGQPVFDPEHRFRKENS